MSSSYSWIQALLHKSFSSFLFPRKPRLSGQSSDHTSKSTAGFLEAQILGPVAVLQTAVSPGSSVFREHPHLSGLRLWTLSSRSPWKRTNVHSKRWERSGSKTDADERMIVTMLCVLWFWFVNWTVGYNIWTHVVYMFLNTIIWQLLLQITIHTLSQVLHSKWHFSDENGAQKYTFHTHKKQHFN